MNSNRKPKLLTGYPSLVDGVFDVLLAVAEDGTMWWLKNPAKNKEWERLPDLPDHASWLREHGSFGDRHERRG